MIRRGMRNGQVGSTALLVLSILVLLGGLVAIGLVVTDSMNYSEVGTAKKVGGFCTALGVIGIVASRMGGAKKPPGA